MPSNMNLPATKAPSGLQKALETLKKVKIPKVPEGLRNKLPRIKLPEMQNWRERTREMVGRRGSRSKPTDYPFLLFHGIRSVQLVSSIVVMAIMSNFLYHLNNEGFGSPWTFILLLTVSIFTILSLTSTVVLHCFYGLNPKINLGLNGGLLLMWTLGWSLLTWWASGTLGHICTIERWNTDLGVMVCRTYKALFAFSLFGFLSTAAAFALDLSVFRRTNAQGKYNQMADIPDGDQKTSTLPNPDDFPQHHDHEMQPMASGLEPIRSPSHVRSLKDAPRADSLAEGSPYDSFKPDVIVPAPKSVGSSSKRPSRDGYEALEPERYDDEPLDGTAHAETPRAKET